MMGMGRATHTNSERFPTRSVIGEDKRRRSEHFITCSNCPAEITANAATGNGALGDEMLTKRFGRAGWYVGRVAGSHICPDCNTTRQRAVLTVVKDEPRIQKEEPVAQPKPVARELSFADRRIINAKLEEVYENELVGYRQGWSDERVATDLGVSLVWVEGLRSQNFGPASGNALVAELRAEQKELALRMEAFRAEGEKLAKAVADLSSRMAQAGLANAA